MVRPIWLSPPPTGSIHPGCCAVTTRDDVFGRSAYVTRLTSDVVVMGSSSILRSGRDVVQAILHTIFNRPAQFYADYRHLVTRKP